LYHQKSGSALITHLKLKIMANFLKATEVPQTKVQLKKALLNGSIVVFEKDGNRDNIYRKINHSHITDMWYAVNFAPKCQGENEATAYLGASFYYKFQKS
jgi:hypothetical protein